MNLSRVSTRSVLAGAFVLLLIIILFFYGAPWINPRFFTQILPTTNSVLPTTSKIALDSCLIKKEGNPLLESLDAKTNRITGTFKGTLTNVSLDSNRGSVILELTSAKKEQSYKFNIPDQKGLAVDGSAQKELKLADIKVGSTVFLSFTCLPQQSNLFKFTKVVVAK